MTKKAPTEIGAFTKKSLTLASNLEDWWTFGSDPWVGLHSPAARERIAPLAAL